MSGTSLNALLFLISIVFDLYLLVLIIRFFLALANAEYDHPFTQFVVKLTNFLVKPLRRFIPNFRGIEIATIVLVLVIEIIKFFIITTLRFGPPNLLGLILLAIGDAIKLGLEVLSFIFLLQLIIYWLQPGSPINHILNQFTAPFMQPLKRLFANTNYVWLAWIFGFIILQLLIIILINPLLAQGLIMAVG